ncbi:MULTISPECIES: hypothetical protein [Enterobacter]|uniref:hypothetical protein n=1 Tax=Enterobacter TaxID=547 RepID=UPI0004A6DEEC|nr:MULTISPECIES: hypothetical protein [Enterobacter]ELV2784655.1 hypothetical protein [Enterobacter cloacae]KVJ36763.1 hypothetical protein AWS33_24115 [Enterobacter cloacae subsp. cloacae]MCM7137772.1 hypothetical protein [Enterobacter cloacae]MCU6208188.1 hypothetical protein [Enterobacter cloacae]CZU92276.1 Uncharacterised protein [Enterobacter cloacae]
MKITEDSLLHSGFTRKEIQKLNNNIANYGGDLDEVVHDLARRFKTLLWIFSCGILFFIYLVFSKQDDHWYVFSGGISILIVFLICSFAQPPIISYKSWRHVRSEKS